MVWSIFFIATIVVVGLLLPLYLRWADRSLQQARVVWQGVAPRIHNLLEDPRMPDRVASHLAFGSLLVGCGCVTSSLVVMELKDLFGGKTKNIDKAAAELSALPIKLRKETEAIFFELIEFDGLHTPIRWEVLKFLMKWNASKRIKPDSEVSHIAKPALVATVRIATGESRYFARSGFPPELEKYSKQVAFG
jgi:hypothetical protein